MYHTTMLAGWADMDFNGHMRNSAYLDKASDSRMRYFADHGFPMSEFARRGFGPVIQRDELEYHREVRLLEELRVTLAGAGLTEDGRRWRLRNEIYRADGKLAARITSVGGWLDLAARKLVVPPPELRELMARVDRTDDWSAAF